MATTSRTVILGRPGDPVTVLVKLKPRLTLAQYHVVQALLNAGDNGLTKDQLDINSGHSHARKILKRLACSDPDWAAVIQMPGISGRRYRIL